MITLNTTSATAISTATGAASQECAAILNQTLCQSVCSNQSVQPSASVTYSIDNTQTSGTTTFVRIKATGTITYVPKNGSNCRTRTQAFTEYTTVIFSNSAATAAPTVTLAQGLSSGYLTNLSCLTAKNYEVATDITITATYA